MARSSVLDIRILVELRRDSNDLNDPFSSRTWIDPSLLLKDPFMFQNNTDTRSHHLSLDQLYENITRSFGSDLAERRNIELGYIQPSGKRRYLKIKNETAFHNAIAVLHRALGGNPNSLINLYLWSPPPLDPVILPHSRNVFEPKSKVPNVVKKQSENILPRGKNVDSNPSPSSSAPKKVDKNGEKDRISTKDAGHTAGPGKPEAQTDRVGGKNVNLPDHISDILVPSQQPTEKDKVKDGGQSILESNGDAPTVPKTSDKRSKVSEEDVDTGGIEGSTASPSFTSPARNPNGEKTGTSPQQEEIPITSPPKVPIRKKKSSIYLVDDLSDSDDDDYDWIDGGNETDDDDESDDSEEEDSEDEGDADDEEPIETEIFTPMPAPKNPKGNGDSSTPKSDEPIDIGPILRDQTGMSKIEKPEQYFDESDTDFADRMARYKARMLERQQLRLNESFDTKVCEQLGSTPQEAEEVWMRVCHFFRHEPDQKQSERIVKIRRGFRRQLLPVQAHTVYWVLQSFFGDAGSCIIGLIMGLGKTTVAFAVILIIHIFNEIFDHIRQHPEKHYDDEHPSASNLCPSNEYVRERWGFDCPCHPESPTSFIRECLGIHEVILPKGLLDEIFDQGRDCYGDDNEFGMRLIRAHKTRLSREELSMMRGEADSYDENGFDEKTNIPYYPDIRGRLENSRCVVITTSGSMVKYAETPLTETYTNWVEQPPKQQKKKGKVVTVQPKPIGYPLSFPNRVVGTVWRDEFHKERNQDSPTVRQIRRLNMQAKLARRKPPLLAIMSGTPLESGPLNLAHYLQLMVRKSWLNHPVLRKFMKGEAINQGNEWKKLCDTRSMTEKKAQKILDEFGEIVWELMIRFTIASDWFGLGPVVKVPKNWFQTVWCDISVEDAEALETHKQTVDNQYAAAEEIRRKHWAKKWPNKPYVARKENKPSVYYSGRVCASFPGARNLTQKGEDGEDQPLRLTKQEWIENKKSQKWEENTSTDPYYSNFQDLYRTSGKLKRIGEIWNDKFKNAKDIEGNPASIIVTSFLFAGTKLLYLYFTEVLGVPKEDIVYITKVNTDKQRKDGLSRFNGFEEGHKPRIFIATTSVFGEGLSFPKVTGLFILEPDWRADGIKQACERHCRQGNLNPEVWTYLFRTRGNGIEIAMVEMNTMRGLIQRVEG